MRKHACVQSTEFRQRFGMDANSARYSDNPSNHIMKTGNGLCPEKKSNQVFAMSIRGVEKVSYRE